MLKDILKRAKNISNNKATNINQSKKGKKQENNAKNTKFEKDIMNNGVIFTIIAIVAMITISIALTPITLQNDTFYTIKIGEHISQNGIDMKDPFSWHEDLSYTYPHWAYDLATYYIYNSFGMTGIYITTCILSAILGVTIYLVNAKLTKNKVLSFIIAIGVMYLIRHYIAASAQLVTFILFGITIFLIEKFLETRKRRYAICLIIIPTIIANIHVAVFPFYFILYLPYIAEYILAELGELIFYRKAQVKILKYKIKKLSKNGKSKEKVENLKNELVKLEETIDKVKIKRTKELQNPYKIRITKNNNVRLLILVMIICAFTGLLTPLGTTPYTYLVKTMQGNTTQNINEHLPMTIVQETDVICALILLLAPLIFTKAKIKLSDLFMIGGLCFLMFASKRQLTMFAIVGSIVLNRLLNEILILYHNKDYIKKWEKALTSLIGIIILLITVLGLTYYFAKDKVRDQYVSESLYPVQACDYILENIDLKTARFYNEYNYGSYMLFRGIPVFIDSRADLYAPEFSGKEEDIFMDFIDTSNIGKFYEDTFEKYDITHVICYKNSKMNMIIIKTEDSNYKELYSDNNFVVYERVKK